MEKIYKITKDIKINLENLKDYMEDCFSEYLLDEYGIQPSIQNEKVYNDIMKDFCLKTLEEIKDNNTDNIINGVGIGVII